MLACDATGDLRVPLKGTGLLVIDGQVDKRGASLALAALFPEFSKCFFDAADRHRDAGDKVHILLQVTP
jgi:hypothetical protein